MKHKYLFMILLLWLCACLFFFQTIYGETKQKAIDELNARQLIHAKQAKTGIENFFKNTIHFLNEMAESADIIDFSDNGRQQIDLALKIIPHEITSITRVDETGKIVYAAPFSKALIGKNISYQAHIQKIMKTKKPVVSDVITAVQGDRAIALHVPILKQGKFKGSIGVLINFLTLSKRFLEIIRIEQTGYAWMTSEKGIELYCPVPGHPGRSVFENCKDFPTIISMANEMLKGEQGETTYEFDRIREKEIETVKKHAVYLPIRLADTFWSIVVATSEDELLATLVSFRNQLLFIFGLLLGGSFFFSYYGMKSWGIVNEQAHRKRAEEELQRIFSMSLDMICVADILNATFLKVNPAFTEILGFSEQELLEKPFLEFIHPEDVETTRNVVEQKLRTGSKVFNFNNRYRCKDGSYRWLSWVSYPVPEKGVTYAVARDITELKENESALIKSKALLDATGRMARVGGWELDARTLAVTWTNETYRIHEVPLGRKPRLTEAIDFFHPEDRPALERAIERALEYGQPYDLEVRFITARGNHLWTRTTCRAEVADGKTIKLMGTFQDISHRKKSELALRESEEKFRNFSEQSFVGFYIIQDGVFQYVNPKFADIFGYTVGECLDSMHFSQLVYPEDLANVQEQIRRRVAGEINTIQYTIRGVKKTGEIIHLSIYGSSLIYQERPAVIGTMMDITKALEMEKRVAQSQRMEAIGNLAGGIAHDFNNILFPIVGMSEMMMEDFPEESNAHQNAKQIFIAGKRGSELVKQILAFSRQSEDKRMPVQFQNVLKEVIKLCRSTIPRDITIRQDIQSNCGYIMANPTQLHQIAMNLITNAYHAVEQNHGEISVKLSETELGQADIPIFSLEPGRYVLLTVSDTGSGIDPAVIDKIFDPYYTTKEKGKGTGLGLSMVHGIVRDYGGDIKVYSEVGKGTSFKVYIPFMEQPTKDETDEKMETTLTGNESILLVDDEEQIVQMQKNTLERLGYKVAFRTGSVDALEAFRANPDAFDLVVTDMSMPNMTGDQLAKKIIAIRQDIPVIICTGFSERINKEKAEIMGIKGFLMKPVVRSEMAHELRRVLDDANG